MQPMKIKRLTFDLGEMSGTTYANVSIDDLNLNKWRKAMFPVSRRLQTAPREMPASSPPLSSPTISPPSPTLNSTNETPIADIPVEIVTEEEMLLIDAALSAAASSSRFASRRRAAPLSSCRSYVTSASPLPTTPSRDIEDSAGTKSRRSPFLDFRSRSGLTVTDITSTEWCAKQKEYSLLHGKPRRTEGMIAGSNRHLQLEEELVEKCTIVVKWIEDSWAVKMLNFIAGTDQLFSEGVTRELPLFGVVEGFWIKGVIDEVRMRESEGENRVLPILVETKTRQKATLPSEAQQRNARLQMMCYKYLWDNLALNTFPKEHFFRFYRLNPNSPLSDDVCAYIASLGLQAYTLEDVVTYFGDRCCRSLPPLQDHLLLRYELQSVNSLLGECRFEFEKDWFQNQMKECIKFWSGEREATYVSKVERWKCRFCSFAAICPMAAPKNLEAPSSSSSEVLHGRV